MTKIILYIATSIDGFIADKSGRVDWLSSFEGTGEDYGYYSLFDSIDGILMGSNTYNFIFEYGEWPYAGKKTFVYTRRKPKKMDDNIEFINGGSGNPLEAIPLESYNRLWLVGGSMLIDSFQKYGLIDEYIISVIPVHLGKGIPLFRTPIKEDDLVVVGTKEYGNGLVQTHYRKKE